MMSTRRLFLEFIASGLLLAGRTWPAAENHSVILEVTQ